MIYYWNYFRRNVKGSKIYAWHGDVVRDQIARIFWEFLARIHVQVESIFEQWDSNYGSIDLNCTLEGRVNRQRRIFVPFEFPLQLEFRKRNLPRRLHDPSRSSALSLFEETTAKYWRKIGESRLSWNSNSVATNIQRRRKKETRKEDVKYWRFCIHGRISKINWKETKLRGQWKTKGN